MIETTVKDAISGGAKKVLGLEDLYEKYGKSRIKLKRRDRKETQN
jgi:hypothetical protein